MIMESEKTRFAREYEESFRIFHETFVSCIKDPVTPNDHEVNGYFFGGKFQKLLWRFKDEAVELSKTCTWFQEINDKIVLLNDKRFILSIQCLELNIIFKAMDLVRVFKAFKSVYDCEPNYVHYIISENQDDTDKCDYLSNSEYYRNDVPNFEIKSSNIWEQLSDLDGYNSYPDEGIGQDTYSFRDCIKAIFELGKMFELIADQLETGSRRREKPFNIIDLSIITNSHLTKQFSMINNLFKAQFYDVIPERIRLCFDYITREFLKKQDSANILTYEQDVFARNIRSFKRLFADMITRNIMDNEDIERLKKFKDWGNLSAHDPFPAITREEIVERSEWIHRLLEVFKNVDADLSFGIV